MLLLKSVFMALWFIFIYQAYHVRLEMKKANKKEYKELYHIVLFVWFIVTVMNIALNISDKFSCP